MAGTDANVITLVDLANLRVLTQIPILRPTALFALSYRDVPGDLAAVVASAGENTIHLLSYPNYQVIPTNQNLPNPQDAVDSRLGLFATVGGQDSLSYVAPGPFGVTPNVIPGIPGAAALAAPVVVYYLDPGFRLRPVYVTALLATSTKSNSLYMIQVAKGLPSTPLDFRIANAASFVAALTTPGSLATAILATGASQAVISSVFGQPLPKTLGGVRLKVGGSLDFDTASNQWLYSPAGSADAPLHFVGPSQINFQVPTGIAPGTNIPAQLTRPDGSTLLTTFNIAPTAPGIFTLLMNGQGQAAALNADYSQNGNPQAIVAAKPAARGSMVQIYATGAGETDPPLLPGEPAPASGNPLVLTRLQPTVIIGGIAARVLFSGMAPGWVGLWQINAVIPENVTSGSAVQMTITAGGVTSNTVTIAVQ